MAQASTINRGHSKGIQYVKYFNNLQVNLIRRSARDKSIVAVKKKRVTAIKEWAVIDLLTSTGLRVSETATLLCGDIRAGYGESSILVRNGKGGITRIVQIHDSLKKHLKQFVKWKESIGESIDHSAPLFIGQRGQWTAQAIQQIVKKHLKQLELYERGKSVHSLRHSYAIEYYRRSKHDIRGLQKQLGHSSIQTTQIYADISNEDIQRNIKNLWSY